MFLRRTERRKDGKTHSYWNIVENKRLDDGRVAQRHVLYPGEHRLAVDELTLPLSSETFGDPVADLVFSGELRHAGCQCFPDDLIRAAFTLLGETRDLGLLLW